MAGRALAVGDQAPAWTLQAGTGQPVSLSDFRGRTVILYFYPKDDTPGCTKEACDFQASLGRVTKADAVVLGVSGDDAASHRRFAAKFRLTFPLLSDPGFGVSQAYGVYTQKSMYGRTYWGIERTTFVIDAAGRIAAIFPKVNVNGHAQEVLEALQGSSPGLAARAVRGEAPARAKALRLRSGPSS